MERTQRLGGSRGVVWAFVMLFSPFLPAKAQTVQTPATLIEEIRMHDEGVAVWWAGHNGWLIKSDGLLISTDLVLEESGRIDSPVITTEELATELDISFVTHWHGDHFHHSTSRVLAEKSDCLFVMPRNCLDTAKQIGIPEERIIVATPGEAFDLEGIQVLPIRAIHGNENFAVYAKANLEDCGYRIKMGGKTILQPGDSVLLEDQLFLGHVDVLFFSPTVHNTHIDRSVILINTLEPDYILPQHRDTYKVTPENKFWTHGYPIAVKKLLSKQHQERYFILDPGERLDIK